MTRARASFALRRSSGSPVLAARASAICASSSSSREYIGPSFWWCSREKFSTSTRKVSTAISNSINACSAARTARSSRASGRVCSSPPASPADASPAVEPPTVPSPRSSRRLSHRRGRPPTDPASRRAASTRQPPTRRPPLGRPPSRHQPWNRPQTRRLRPHHLRPRPTTAARRRPTGRRLNRRLRPRGRQRLPRQLRLSRTARRRRTGLLGVRLASGTFSALAHRSPLRRWARTGSARLPASSPAQPRPRLSRPTRTLPGVLGAFPAPPPSPVPRRLLAAPSNPQLRLDPPRPHRRHQLRVVRLGPVRVRHRERWRPPRPAPRSCRSTRR